MREGLYSGGGNSFLHHFVNDLGGGFVVSRCLRKKVIDTHIRQPHKTQFPLCKPAGSVSMMGISSFKAYHLEASSFQSNEIVYSSISIVYLIIIQKISLKTTTPLLSSW
jgi:hypothetical protein